jgi:hypothetical protein
MAEAAIAKGSFIIPNQKCENDLINLPGATGENISL